ncbi:MAG: hypothetical protein JWM95_2148 [Gemmatimonadetes bacterium]|nr:hypothetical protein [Gemmatimonadota bacterium]
MNTVNPPGNEMQVATFLVTALEGEGIETTLFAPAPGRAAVVARIRGNGNKRPVLIMAHMDVVDVEAEHWSTDPFGAEVRDGYVYGRGAIDDKGMLAVNLETMLLLQRSGIALSRDVIFVANSDEEQGGAYGMGWLIDNHPDLIDAELVLNEGGRTRMVDGALLYVALQSAEKVSHVVDLIAHGPGGHAAIPLEGNAIARLGRALAALSSHREPLFLTPTTREFFTQLSRVWQDARERQAMTDVLSDEPRRGEDVLASIPVFDAVLRAGVSPVMLHAGIRSNVIPTEATAQLNVRTLPGQSIDDVVARLVAVIGDDTVDVVISERGIDSPASDFTSPLFTAIRETAAALHPSLVTVPYLSTGATDSARLRNRGMQALGLLPFPMDQDDEDRMHGNDERVPLASLEFGTRLIYGAIARVAQ